MICTERVQQYESDTFGKGRCFFGSCVLCNVFLTACFVGITNKLPKGVLSLESALARQSLPLLLHAAVLLEVPSSPMSFICPEMTSEDFLLEHRG